MLVRREGANGTHKDFQVCRSKVLDAFIWLKPNNTYFHSISLNHVALAQLPEDGNFTNFSTVRVENQPCDDGNGEPSDDPYNAFLPGSFVRVAHTRETEQNMVRLALLQSHCPSQPLPWPQVSGAAVNEFQTEGYMSLAFPTLFPTGSADFSAPRLHSLTIGYYTLSTS